MSILKYIMSPFVEFKDEANSLPSKDLKTQRIEKKESLPDAENQPDASGTSDTDASSLSYTSSQSSAPDASLKSGEYQKHFENLIEEANAKNPVFQGTDFKEFIDSKIDVEAIADEETKYRTAFNVLKRTGLTKERLISTGQEYINLIDHDLRGFNDAFLQQYNTQVEQKDQLLEKKAQELKALNDKTASLNNEIKQMSQEIIQSKDKLNSNKNSFILAGESKKTEIKAELQKIDQYFS